jgi:hypothetical protein
MADYNKLDREIFDATKRTQRIYAQEIGWLQGRGKRLWYQHVSSDRQRDDQVPFRRLWELREKDPLDTLKLILIQVLCHFFHWMLQKMSDTLRTVSSLQMYINPTACQRD